jgi:hypothetical protein
MPRKSNKQPDRRSLLLSEIGRLAPVAIAGAASQTYRTCGNPGCRCHAEGPKHGPHMYVSFRGDAGKTTGYYVPKAAQDEILAGIQAWQTLKELLRELSDLNTQDVLARAREARVRST